MKIIKFIGFLFFFVTVISCGKDDETVDHTVPDNYDVEGTVKLDKKQVVFTIGDENPDGDIVDIYVNGDLFANDVSLTITPKIFDLSLDEGTSYLGIEAVNVGTGGTQTNATPTISITDDTQTQVFTFNVGYNTPKALVLEVEL